MPLYRKRSEPVEARVWTGLNGTRMVDWLGYAWIEWVGDGAILIENHNGRVVARKGDWIVHENGGFYPVAPIKFQAEYEPV